MTRENKQFNITYINTDFYSITKIFDKRITIPKNNGKRGKRGQAIDKEKSVYSSLHRSRQMIFNYAIANSWDLWGTLTLDKLKINRYDLDKIQRKLSQFLSNLKKLKHKELKWLIVPEHHKDKAWHFHLLLSGLPMEELKDTGKTYKATNKKMYNWIEYQKKFGFNSFIDVSSVPIEEMYKISNYITKYITKAFCVFRMNKKKYWSSKGLAVPTKTNTLLNYDEYVKLLTLKYSKTDSIIHQSEYNFKNRLNGEIENTVFEFVEINLPF